MPLNESDKRERISAFMDGELRGSDCDRVIESLYASPELRREWVRFHLIGDALRKIGPIPGAATIADRVSAGLARERIVHAGPRFRRRVWAPLPGLALAASVAAVAILGVRSLDDGMEVQTVASVAPVRQAALAAPPARSGTGSRVQRVAAASAQRVLASSAGRPWSDATGDAGARINAYLIHHSEHAGLGVRGVLPYVRVVGYQSDAGDSR